MIFSHPGCCLSCHHIFVVVNLHYGFDGKEAGNGCILDYREHSVPEQPFLIQLISLIRFVNDTYFQGSGFVDDGGRYIQPVVKSSHFSPILAKGRDLDKGRSQEIAIYRSLFLKSWIIRVFRRKWLEYEPGK